MGLLQFTDFTTSACVDAAQQQQQQDVDQMDYLIALISAEDLSTESDLTDLNSHCLLSLTLSHMSSHAHALLNSQD